MTEGISQAMLFSIDVQTLITEPDSDLKQHNLRDLTIAIKKTLEEYPEHTLGEAITFSDGSTLRVTNNGILHVQDEPV